MAAPKPHTYSTSCMLHESSNEFTRRASVVSIDPPKIKAQYFYCSTLPIDDPLSPVPPPSSNPASKSSKVPPRPFSVHDNIALEEAWLKFQKPVRSKESAPGAVFNTTNVAPRTQEHIAQNIKDANEKPAVEPGRTNSRGFEAVDLMPQDRNDMVSRAIGNTAHPAGLGREHRPVDPDLTLCDDPEHIPFDETMPVSSEDIGSDELETGLVKKKRSWSPFRRRDNVEHPKDRVYAIPTEPPSPGTQDVGEVNFGSSLPERDTSGTPFLRIPSRMRGSRSRLRSRSRDPPHSAPEVGQSDGAQSPESHYPKIPSPLKITSERSIPDDSGDDEDGSGNATSSRRHSLRRKQSKVQGPEGSLVAVGMLRLHVVQMPSLWVSTQCSI